MAQIVLNSSKPGFKVVSPPEPPILPTDARERKEYPIFTGLLAYFPRACAAVAHHSYVSNKQHNGDGPIRWAKEKSVGTGDEIIRHLMEEDYEAVAWRGLELLERKLAGLPPFDKEEG